MRALFVGCAVLASSAFAHIKLTEPGSFQVTDANGSPNKSEPCGGAGTATGVVTTVVAGSQLTVSWGEPIPHPGHFRIGIATNPTDFVTPVPTLSNNGTNCASLTPVANPTYPVLVDGLFPHTSSTGSWTTTVTVPNISCTNCTLQVMQFMSSHGPPCFYYQCAKLNIVQPDAGSPVVDAGVADAGAVIDAGATGGGAGGGGGSVVPTECSAANCAGCCVGGICQSGDTDQSCGRGNVCLACSAEQSCSAGQCVAAQRGCGCTSGPMALLLLFPLVFLFRKSPRPPGGEG